MCATVAIGGRSAPDAEAQLPHARTVDQALLDEAQAVGDHARVEDLDLRTDAELAHSPGGRAQPVKWIGEHPLVAEVHRPAVERGHLGPELEAVESLIKAGPAARASGAEVEDRLAAGLTNPPHQLPKLVRVLRRLAVGATGVEMDHRRTRPRARHRRLDDRVVVTGR